MVLSEWGVAVVSMSGVHWVGGGGPGCWVGCSLPLSLAPANGR